uniref:HNH nuclease domain-containing protein n=2 Tax=Chlamydomonas euryale TaxID=1486919 RepID=A0A7R9Z2P6_9CHLO|mmetsp:Transcript_40870/g.122010  ORF Transcript_40870/g.122010 Transcript_40870/m.122010 type:complete len:171 (+) Transcript_40870:81-593(+)
MMDWSQRVEVVEYYPPPATAWSGQGEHMLPAVIRVPNRYLNLNEIASDVACTRRNVLVRDRYTCQYCGCSSKHLTLDHVVPVSKGGRNEWLNLVTACVACNQRKGDKTLQALGWKLRAPLRKPSPWELGLVIGLSPGDVERPSEAWAPYLEPYRAKIQDIRRMIRHADKN